LRFIEAKSVQGNAWCGGQRPAIRALMRSINRLLDAHSEILSR
jgi:hypothetical protein